MFGYVIPPLGQLEEADREQFRCLYCGLCHTLGRRCGTLARGMLNYDLTFLAILLSGPEEPAAEERRCMVHPLRARQTAVPTAAMETAADMSVILTWWQLRDGVADHGLWKGLGYRGAGQLLRSTFRRAAERQPAFDACVRTQLEALGQLERERSPSLDAAADTFALLLAGAAETVSDTGRQRVLREIFYHLGRWIYLIDAADDLAEDMASGNYNPLILRYHLEEPVLTGENRAAFASTLDHSIHRMAAAFELAEFGCWTPLLEALFYTGLFQTGRSVLDGTFHRRRGRQEPDGNRNAEHSGEH